MVMAWNIHSYTIALLQNPLTTTPLANFIQFNSSMVMYTPVRVVLLTTTPLHDIYTSLLETFN